MNNDYSANPVLQEAVLMGQFRLSYIAPIVNGTFTDSSIREYCKRVTENELTLPNGEKSKILLENNREMGFRLQKSWFRSFDAKSKI